NRRRGLSIRAFEIGDQRIDRARVPHGEDEARALVPEPLRDRSSQSARRARHEARLPGELAHVHHPRARATPGPPQRHANFAPVDANTATSVSDRYSGQAISSNTGARRVATTGSEFENDFRST